MTVINPSSISGITSITLPAGADNVLTIQTNDGTERFRIDSSGNVKVGSACTISQDGDVFFTGVTTATTFAGAHSGSGANLTSLPAAQITGTLPAISAANLTNVPAANITGTLPAIDGSNLTGIGGTDFIHAEQINVSGVTTSQAFIPSQGQLSNRNLIINGDFQISQRATSSTDNNYGSVDRWTCQQGNLDEACTQEQADVAEGTSPYAEGFRHSWKITNGNQTSGAGAGDYIEIYQYIEGHTIANCGWDYKNANSKMTLSFWIKSSVAQKFAGFLYTTLANGTSVGYMYDYSIDNGGSNLSADTWTKITHTFPGNSNLNITNGPNYGLGFGIYPFQGTDFTTSRSHSEAWQTWTTSNKVPDMTSTWYTTNDATLEITGVQLEVGSVATPYEHKKRSQELADCMRYYQIVIQSGGGGGGNTGGLGGTPYTNGSSVYCPYRFPVEMRAEPSVESTSGTGSGSGTFRTRFGNNYNFNNFSGFNDANNTSGTFITNGNAGGGDVGNYIWIETNAGAKLALDAEL